MLLSPELDTAPDFTNQATVLGNLVVLDCHPASRDFALGAATMLHEMCYALSAQQRRMLQYLLEGWYLQ